MELNEKIRSLREERAISQAELAKELHVTRQTISRWEVGTVVPSSENLLALCKLYDIPFDELLGGEPAQGEKKAPPRAPAGGESGPHAKSTFLAACILAACILIGAAVTCVGFYITNRNIDRLTRQNDVEVIPMEELNREEVDYSAWTKIYLGVPES